MSATRSASFWYVRWFNCIRASRSKVLCLHFPRNSFQVYDLNREILTCHEISIGKIESSDEDEYDPIELWNAVQEVSRDYRFFQHFP